MKFTISVPRELIERLKDFSEETDRPMSRIITKLLKDYLDKGGY